MSRRLGFACRGARVVRRAAPPRGRCMRRRVCFAARACAAREGVCVLRRPLLAMNRRRGSYCAARPSDATHPAGPPRLDAATPVSKQGVYYQALSWLLWFAVHRRGLWLATPPLLTAFGRTPAAGRRDPRRGSIIKRFLGFCGSRSGRGWSWATKANPNVDSSSVIATLWGARRESRGSARARSARRGSVAQHKRSLMQ